MTRSATVPAPPPMGHRSTGNGELPRRLSGELHRPIDPEREGERGKARGVRLLTLESLEVTARLGEDGRRRNRRKRAAAGDEEDDDCGRTAARLGDSVHEEDDGDEAELPVHSDALLAVQNAGNDDGHGGTVLVRVSSRGTERRGGGKWRAAGERGGPRAPYPRHGAARGAVDGASDRAPSPSVATEREVGDDRDFYTEPPAIFKFLTKRSLPLFKFLFLKFQQQYSAVFGARINF